MYFLILVAACLTVASANPHYVGSPVVGHTVVEEPGVVKVGELLENVPSAVSYQSQTQYHTRKYTTPIVAPVLKAYSVPIATSYYRPSDPSLRTYTNHVVPAASVHQLPVRHYSSPVPETSVYRPPFVKTFVSPPYPVAKTYHTQTVHPEGELTTYVRSPLYTTIRKTHFPATVKTYGPYLQY